MHFKLQTLERISSRLNPLHSNEYYRDYINHVKQIHLYKDPKASVGIVLTILLICFQSMRHLNLSISSSTLSEHSLVVQYNPTYILMGNNLYNIVWLCLGLITVLFFLKLFFKVDYRLCQLLDRILFSPAKEIFTISSNYQMPQMKSGECILTVRRFAYHLVNIFHVFVLVACKYKIGLATI